VDVSRETPPWAAAYDAPSAPGDVSRETSAADVVTPARGSDTPLGDQAAIDARRRIRLAGLRFPKPSHTRIITVANQKGGVGKTSTAVNLAAALAKGGLRVLVIDTDPQGNASTALGIDHHQGVTSIYDVLLGGTPMLNAVAGCPDVAGLWCVPATLYLSRAEIELVNLPRREYRLIDAMDELRRGLVHAGEAPLDYIFIDCPPSLGLLTLNAFVAANEVLIPIQCEYYALEGLSQLNDTITGIKAGLNPELVLSTILLTMYDARTNLAHDVVNEVRQWFPAQTLQTTIPRSVKISEAPGFDQTVITWDPNSSGALAYLAAAQEIAERGRA
jgi:chromosome partitioning protein